MDMEFGEKLKKLRIENNWTQEQVAQKLFISRAAISKWESGRGYPNIESLKDISRLYNQSIDDLLSNEEILVLAENTNKNNISSISGFIYGILDIVCIFLIFLPLFAKDNGRNIVSSSLLDSVGLTSNTKIAYLTILSILSIIGILEIISLFIENKRCLKLLEITSLIIQSLAVLMFTVSRQPYLTACVFILLLIKILIFIQEYYKTNSPRKAH